MEEKQLRISVVIPLFNEEECIHHLYDRLNAALQAYGESFEIIFVDDGSTDSTFQHLQEIRENDPRVRLIKFRKNYGQTPAMSAGFDHAQGEVIVCMDGDLQNDPADIPRLVRKLEEGYDIVSGWRKDRKDKLITRRIPSMAANYLIGVITGVRIHDYGCSLKAYKTQVLKSLSLYSDMHRFIPAVASITGANTAELVVTHHSREFGKSKYGISRIFKVFLDLFVVKMITGFSSRPFMMFLIFSLPFLFIALLFLVVSANLYLHPNFQDNFFPIIFPSVCFLNFYLFFHLVFLGYLGEMALKTGTFKPGRLTRPTAIVIE